MNTTKIVNKSELKNNLSFDKNTYVVNISNHLSDIDYVFSFLLEFYKHLIPYGYEILNNGINILSKQDCNNNNNIIINQPKFIYNNLNKLFNLNNITNEHCIVFNEHYCKVILLKELNNIKDYITIKLIKDLLFNSYLHFNYLKEYPYHHMFLKIKIYSDEIKELKQYLPNMELPYFVLDISNLGKKIERKNYIEFYEKKYQNLTSLRKFVTKEELLNEISKWNNEY